MDLCSHIFGTRVSCSHPAVDDYPVTNLVGSLPRCSQGRDFITESFVKLPVDINFEFKFAVYLSHLKFNSKLGSKQSTGFAVYVSDSPSPQDNNDAQASNIIPVNPEDHLLLGKFFTNKEEMVCLSNPWYDHNCQTKKKNPHEVVNQNSTFHGTLRNSTNHHAMKNVRRLKLRILRRAVSGGSPIGSLEIWGQPGNTCSAEKKQALVNKWNSALKESSSVLQNITPDHRTLTPSLQYAQIETLQLDPPVGNTTMNVLSNKNGAYSTSAQKQSSGDDEIPGDFIDPITCELMVIPMLLPSGNSIDASTLDKLLIEGSRWNRPPSDPFTGVRFTERIRPQPNVALKARIDRYVVLNQHDSVLNCVGRTLLPATTSVSPSSSSAAILPSDIGKMLQRSPSPVNNTPTATQNYATVSSLPTSSESCKRRKLDDTSVSSSRSCRQQSKKGNVSLPAISSDCCTDNSSNKRSSHVPLMVVPGRPSSSNCRPQALRKHSILLGSTNLESPSSSSAGTSHHTTSVPISRSLLGKKPNSLIQGDGATPEHAKFCSESLLKSKDQCCACKTQAVVYILEKCGHLMCRPCMTKAADIMNVSEKKTSEMNPSPGKEHRGAPTASVSVPTEIPDIHGENVTIFEQVRQGILDRNRRYFVFPCGYCNVHADSTNIVRYHSKSVFSR